MAEIEFHDYSLNVKDALKEAGVAFLEEACGELEAQTKRNCRVKTGQTKGSFQHVVDEGALIGAVGSNYENAIWEEMGTGIYAVNGDGRKDVPWVYYDEAGKKHITSGKAPQRMLFNAFSSLKGTIENMCKERFSNL